MLFDPQRRADGVAAALLQAYLIVENTGQCKLAGHNAMDDKARIGHVELESNEDGQITSRQLIVGLLLATFAALSPDAKSQDLSANQRLLAGARAGDEAGVSRALGEGASPNARNRVGETALLTALKSNRPELARQMIAAGADVN